jgi:hypothetical protein
MLSFVFVRADGAASPVNRGEKKERLARLIRDGVSATERVVFQGNFSTYFPILALM